MFYRHGMHRFDYKTAKTKYSDFLRQQKIDSVGTKRHLTFSLIYKSEEKLLL